MHMDKQGFIDSSCYQVAHTVHNTSEYLQEPLAKMAKDVLIGSCDCFTYQSRTNVDSFGAFHQWG